MCLVNDGSTSIWSIEELDNFQFGQPVMKPTHEIEEKRDQRLQNKPLRGGNLLYIAQMKNYWTIQMTRPHFYI